MNLTNNRQKLSSKNDMEHASFEMLNECYQYNGNNIRDLLKGTNVIKDYIGYIQHNFCPPVSKKCLGGSQQNTD